MSEPTLSICVCTSGRPVELARCLESIKAGTRLPEEVIVSDDSCKPATSEQIQSICSVYPFVKYFQGPRRGLCANRNYVLRQAMGTHISLLDDDACAGPEFVFEAIELARTAPRLTILTGDVLEHGANRQSPTNPTFLGHFGRPVAAGERLANINLNCNIFPREAFDTAIFDERIVFGYEDTDLCAQLLSAGFTISHISQLLNNHIPPGRGVYRSKSQEWDVERARFYTSVRRYINWQPNPLRMVAFAALAPLHLALYAGRKRMFRRVFDGWIWLGKDLVIAILSRKRVFFAGQVRVSLGVASVFELILKASN